MSNKFIKFSIKTLNFSQKMKTKDFVRVIGVNKDKLIFNRK
jgi:hypothetical protein